MKTISNLETDFLSLVFFSFAKQFINMNLIAIYFCTNLFFGNDLIKNFKFRKLYAVSIFFGISVPTLPHA